MFSIFINELSPAVSSAMQVWMLIMPERLFILHSKFKIERFSRESAINKTFTSFSKARNLFCFSFHLIKMINIKATILQTWCLLSYRWHYFFNIALSSDHTHIHPSPPHSYSIHKYFPIYTHTTVFLTVSRRYPRSLKCRPPTLVPSQKTSLDLFARYAKRICYPFW